MDVISLNVYCIIVTYNAMKWIDRCLNSLKCSSVPISPVVIDNCSTDGTLNYISNNYKEVTIIRNTQNRGFGQANNQGIEYAYKQGATHFFLLNQDAWIYEDTIYNLLAVYNNFSVDLISPIHLSGDGSIIDDNFYTQFIELNADKNRLITSLFKNQKDDMYVSDNIICAAAWLLPKSTIDTIGGFDPLFFHYGEDVNYLQRLRYHKMKVAVCPNAFILHDRKKRGNVNVYNKYSYLNRILLTSLDVSKINNRKRNKAHLKNLFLFISFLIKFQIKKCNDIISTYFYLFKIRHKISHSIMSNKIIGPSWLNI